MHKKIVLVSALILCVFGINSPGFSETQNMQQEAQQRQIVRILGLFPPAVVKETVDQIANGELTVSPAPNRKRAAAIEAKLLQSPTAVEEGEEEETTCEYFGCNNYCVGDANWNHYKCGEMGCVGKPCADGTQGFQNPAQTQGR